MSVSLVFRLISAVRMDALSSSIADVEIGKSTLK
jgi:hypothetical protein